MHAAGGAGLAGLSLGCQVFSKTLLSLLCSLSASPAPVTCFSRRDHDCVRCVPGCSFVRLVPSRVRHGRTPRRVPMQRLMPSHLSPAKSPLTRSPWLPPRGSTSALALCTPHEWPIEWPEIADGCGGSDRDVKVHLRLPAEGRRSHMQPRFVCHANAAGPPHLQVRVQKRQRARRPLWVCQKTCASSLWE
jgi:hypothetical protein